MAVTLLAMLMFMSVLAQSYSPEVGEGYISFDFREVYGGTVGSTTTFTREDVFFKDYTAVKLTPTPETATGVRATLDCWTLGSFGDKVTVPGYNYVGITYYYETDAPSYTGKLTFSVLSGNTNAVQPYEVQSADNIVTNQWTEAVFDLSDMKINPDAEKKYINQVHFRPFGNTAPNALKATDVLYVSKYTFYGYDPTMYADANIRFLKGTPAASGEDKTITVPHSESYVLPENPYTYEGAEFLGWVSNADNKLYAAGTVFNAAGKNITYTAKWRIEGEPSEYLSIDFADYYAGTVSGRNTAFHSVVEFDGKSAVKIVPNPDNDAANEDRPIIMEGFNYAGAGIDLTKYTWFAAEYYYASDTPCDTPMQIELLKNGNVLVADGNNYLSTENLIAGTWAVALFDLTDIASKVNPAATAPMLRQMYVRPFGYTSARMLSKDETIYISKLMFFTEKPDFIKHASYMNGYEDGTFKPSGTMTRAEACTVVARLLENEDNITGTSAFSDVAADAWYSKYIGFCEGRGILKTYSGAFMPDTPITRAEFAELVYLTGLAKDKGTATAFADVNESHPKYQSVNAASGAGLINGYDNGDGTFSFKPDNTITRAEVVTVINRARGESKKTESLTNDIVLLFTDVDITHWAFADIAEASVPHVEWNGKWLYPEKHPLNALGEKIDLNSLYDTAAGNAKVAEIDALEEKRIAEIRNTPSMDFSGISGKKIYVSANGNDANTGLSEAATVKTIAKANTLAVAGDVVLLKRGDLWREPFTALSGVTYSAYGEGEKPKIYGSPKNAADSSLWTLIYEDEESGKLIWRYNDWEELYDVGILVFNGGEGFARKELAYSVGGKFTHPDRVTEFDYIKELDENYEFFHAANTMVNGAVINVGASKGELYFRCDDGNPGKVFNSIEMNQRRHLVTIGGDNVTIDNLCLMYGGAHGISSGSVKGLIVTNCEIGWIGGSIQGYNANGRIDGGPTRYGNGVEVYGSVDNYTIDNCHIYQCYDAGVTHQVSQLTPGDFRMDNITYSNNVITECVYSIEYFLSSSSTDPGAVRQGNNVLYDGNILRRAGFGFGSTRPDKDVERHIRCGAREEFTNYRITNNIFDRSSYELVQTTTAFEETKPDYEGNIFIQGVGNRLYNHGLGSSGVADVSAPYAIKGVLGDSTGEMYFVEKIAPFEYSYDSGNKLGLTEAERAEAEKLRAELEAKKPKHGIAQPVNDNESTEIHKPLFIKTAKDGNLGSKRDAMNVQEMTDEATGIVYMHITPNDSNTSMLFDCMTDKYSLESGVVYYKVLMRCNSERMPFINVYGLKDKNGVASTGIVIAEANISTKGNDEWEEVIVVAKTIPEDAVSSNQIHLQFAGNATRGTHFYKDGKLIVDGVYFDVAAFAAFDNAASANAFDLSEAAKK